MAAENAILSTEAFGEGGAVEGWKEEGWYAYRGRIGYSCPSRQVIQGTLVSQRARSGGGRASSGMPAEELGSNVHFCERRRALWTMAVEVPSLQALRFTYRGSFGNKSGRTIGPM